MKEPTGFSVDDVLQDCRKIRGQRPLHPKLIQLTEEEKEALIRIREMPNPPSWIQISKNWEKWFGRKIGKSTLMERHRELVEQKSEIL